ncbi:MAG: sigma-70 family RNA polymerase sigma factor [Candidatus Hydrogenedentota bacterium]
MATYNPDFWEIPTQADVLDRVASTRALWYEDDIDRRRREALADFFHEVTPAVQGLIDSALTRRQQEVLKLYYFYGKTQEEIAAILQLTQSTVSRHLFGTVRDGHKVGGAIRKLQRAIHHDPPPTISGALSQLEHRLAKAI